MAFDLLAYAKERKKETSGSTQQTHEGQGQFDLKDYALRKNAGNLAKGLSDRVNTWLQNHNNYIQNYQTRYSGRKFNYEDAYVSDSSDWLDTVNKQRLNFQAEADNILSYLDQYKGYLDSEYVSQIQKTLTDSLQQQKSISAAASQDNDWWSNFGDEKKYQTAVRYDGFQKKYSGKEYDDIQKAIEVLDDGEEKEWLRMYQGEILKGNEDFLEFSKKGASIANPTFDDAQYNGVLFGLKWGNDDVGNIVTFSRDNWEAIANDMADENLHVVGNYLYHYMDENEVDVYNYLLAKEGKERAQQYLDSLEDQLNRRAGTGMAQNIMGIDNDILRVVTQGTFGLTAGLDQWASGTRQFFTDEQLPTSPTQYANAEIYNSLDGFGQNLYTATNVIGNMAPSILVSAVAGGLGVPLKLAQGAGALTMGVSAAGNAYADALDKGYEKGQARTYSTLVGAAEGGLQYLMGGIGKLGGVGTEKIMSKVAMIDNSLLRISAKLGVDLLGEVAEEELQNFLEPALRSIIFGEDYDMPTIDELLETAIVTAITTPILGGKDTIMEDLSESKYYKDTYGGSQNELVGEALEIDPNNAYAQKLQGYLDNGKNLNGNQLNRLVQQNDAAITAQDMTTIQSAAESRLTELGETGDVSAVAAALTKQAAGQKLTKAEQQTISNSKYGQRVANELNPDNINSGDYSSQWAQKLDTERINAQEYSRLVEAAQLPQETANITGEQVVTEAPKAAQTAQTETVQPETAQEIATAAVQPRNDNAVANDQQVAGKLTGKESLQVTEETPATEEAAAGTVSLEDASQKYGAQAQAMVHTYKQGQDVAKYDSAYQVAYDMGKSGVSFDYVKGSPTVSYLTDTQKELAYAAGKAASDTEAQTLDTSNKAAANGKAGRKKGVVRGEGVTIADLKQTFNDTQGKAYKYLSTVAEVTGIDIVLYRSEAGEDGKFQGAQGRYSRSEPGTIYIDLNAGLSDIKSADDLAKYAMLRTFAHEFTHFIEKWNPIQYNELRKVVFDTLTERGENVHDLIEDKQARNPGMSYDKASREVVAEAMTDILPDANFVQRLAENHKTIFQKLLEQLKEFAQNLRDYFNSIGYNSSKEANALKEQVGETVKYLDSIVQLFDQVAAQAVENYQQTVAEDVAETTTSEDISTTEATSEVTTEETTSVAAAEEESRAVVEENATTTATDEAPFDKRTLSHLKAATKVMVTGFGGQKYVSDSYVLISTTDEGVAYAKAELNAKDNTLPDAVQKTLQKADKLIDKAPMEGKSSSGAVYVFDIDGVKQYFGKKLFSFIDGGLLYYGKYTKDAGIIKSVGEDGSVKGYLIGMRVKDASTITDIKPAKLKSFSKKMQALINAQTEPAAHTESVTKPAKPKTVESSVKMEDFGEKIGGARKDQWSKRGLLAGDLDAMNDREREKNVKKDNVWKRPDYKKLIEGGADRNTLFVRNEIRKALNQTIRYPYKASEEQKLQIQKEFVDTIRAVQTMAEKATSKEDFSAMGRQWLIVNGYIDPSGKGYTDKWRKNPALQGTDYVYTIEHLVRSFDSLFKLADNANFAVDAEKKVPAGFAIHEDERNGTWFIAKGNLVVKHSIPTYDEALNILRNVAATNRKKSRFVPKQLQEVHRKGPDYRGGKDVNGQDYLDIFGFRGGEFGNWMNEKDRRVSMNYGFDALKDMADALGIADGDISLSGNLSIAFGARGQGLSGAAAHYERERHVINLTKMNGAGSLAHEWFHALDDFIGGYGSNMATDSLRGLPDGTKTALRDLLTTMQYRDATHEETDMAATKSYEQAKRSVTYQVKSQFGWVEKIESGALSDADTRYYSRKPTAADVEKYHELLDKLLETGDTAIVDELSALRKEVNGRVIPKEDRESIGYRLYALKPAAAKNVQKMRLRSDFYNNSRRFGELHQKDGDYWDSTVEMAARAFACYVADKTGKNNDYLSAHADSAVTLDMDKNGNVTVVRAYPTGQERETINAAFDRLIDALKEDGFLHEQGEFVKPDIVQYQSRAYLSNEAEEFRSDIDTWDRSGRPAGETFILGSTGDVLQGLGAIESDVYVQGNKINTIFKDHPEMTTKEIKNLPEILENPVMVLASRNLNRGMQANTRLTIFGMVKAQNGLPVMVAFDLHPVENKLYLSDMQKVVSAYTKDNSPTAAMKLMQNSDVLYADKEKTASLLHTVGFHNAYRIEQSGYIGNIAYEDDAVKITGKQFNEVFLKKEEQALDSVAEDDVQYQQRDYLEDGDIRDDIYYPKNNRDAHAFIRSFANKTSGMQDGTIKNVFLTTANHAYFVAATGYLKGDIERVIPIFGNEDIINEARKEFRNDTYTGAETFDTWAQTVRSNRGRDGWDYAVTGHTGVSGRNDDLDDGPSGSNTFGSAWESLGYNSWEELREAVASGAMIMDENGDLIQFQQRTDTLTDREVLAMAASQVKVDDLTAAEKDALDIFQKRLSKMETLQAERAEQGRIYKEQQFGAKVDRAKAAETLNRMHVLDSQIQKANADVLTVEEKTVLKRVLQKARTVVEQQERQHGQEILKRWRDRRNNADAIKKYRDRLRADVDELTNWVLHPDNKNVVKHIPDALKNTVVSFLSSINFMSKRSLGGGNATVADKAFMEQARRLAKVMEGTVNVDEMYSNYTDLPPDFMQNLRRFMDTAQDIVDSNSGDFIINQMTAEELQNLSKVVRTLKKYIMQMNRFHVNAMFKHVYEAGENSIDFLAQLNPAENTGAVSEFLLWQQMRPAYAFERFGEGGMAIYDGLRRGQATLAFNTKKIQAFAEKAYTTAEVKAWEDQVKTIRLGPDKYVKMRVSQIMSLYELNKREQAQGHIFGEGIRVATFKAGNKKISDVGQTLTPGELNLILRELTPRQKEVADSLQQFMQQQGGEWGNYVTVARFGEKQFGEENYFPINSDGRHLSVDADEKPGAAALYALLNMGFTKQTQEKAKNRIVVYSIFDVFANHMASMAQYNAFALPVVDALKWFNYQRVHIDEDGTKTLLGSVREQMDRAFGVPEESRPGSGRRGYAQNFVINIIKAFNGTEAQGTAYDSLGLQTLHHYNRAQVAYNFRVVVQQPLAITRAAQLLDYGSILKGMKLAPAAIRKNVQEMQHYSGIAAWKSLGFYDVNISRGLTSLIKHDDTALDKIIDVGMWGAEKADLWTWAAIWSAAKEEVICKQKLTPKSEGFYEAVTKLFEDVIYKTQVVDSVLTKNEFMRDKGFFARAVGSFMSESTTTASMLVDAYDKYHMDMQRGMTRQQAWKKNSKMIVRTAYVYGVGALILAAVQAVADAFRDDDDYQAFMEKWLEAFGGNLVDEVMPVNKLPIVSDFYELAKKLLSIVGVDTYGNPPQSVFMQWYDSLVKGVEILYDRISGESTNYTWYGGAYKLLQAASGISGLPMAAATREIITAWNNTVGAMAPSLKVKTYEPSEKAQIKYAYEDGYLTSEEAKEQLLQQNLVDTEDEAYWTIQGWEAGDGYSRYDAIFDAVRNNGDFNAAMRELTSHGYTEKDVLSNIKGKIGEWYKGGEITKQQATSMLSKYMGMDSEDITETVNKWSSKVVTGIAFEDIKDEYLSGSITAANAIDMYVRYGGYTKDKATETVNKWRAEKETGVAYDDIKDAFMDGDISQGDAKNMYMTYGGLTEEKAAEKVTVLAFVKKYPDLDDITYTAIEKYQTYCETAGVPAETFYDAWKYESNTDADVDAKGESISGSKKVKVLAYINGLDLTYAQKDSLYYAFGWAESKISEAPWH